MAQRVHGPSSCELAHIVGATVLHVVRAGRQVSHATPTRKPNISAIAVYGLWVLLLAWGNGDTTISNYCITPLAGVETIVKL